jgi:uracil-DNA glycosylase
VRRVARYCRDLGWSDPPTPALEGPAAPAQALSACATLGALADEAQGCTRCRLAQSRRSVVFGEGAARAPVLFVGEGPGADEDASGRPFVGQAGKLLEAMLSSLDLRRDDVYIANVVKCRPPGNREPEADEVAACAAFLDRQIELIAPSVIVALGVTAMRRLTGTSRPMRASRGRWTSYRGVPLLPTFHPAYLLRNPQDKRLAWDDLKALRRRLTAPS